MKLTAYGHKVKPGVELIVILGERFNKKNLKSKIIESIKRTNSILPHIVSDTPIHSIWMQINQETQDKNNKI